MEQTKIPKWQQNWNKHNTHKVNGKMVPKEHPKPAYPPDLGNHDRSLIRQAAREVKREQEQKRNVQAI
jgi:hypothetical protein